MILISLVLRTVRVGLGGFLGSVTAENAGNIRRLS